LNSYTISQLVVLFHWPQLYANHWAAEEAAWFRNW